MAVSDLTGHYIADTYQNVVQCDFDLNGSTNNLLYNGKGLPIVIDSDIIKFSLATGGGLQTFGGNFVLRSNSGDTFISANGHTLTLGQDSLSSPKTDTIFVYANKVKMISISSNSQNNQIGRGSDGAGGTHPNTVTDGTLGYSNEIISTHYSKLTANLSYGGYNAPYLAFETGGNDASSIWQGHNFSGNHITLIDPVDYDRQIFIQGYLPLGDSAFSGNSGTVETQLEFRMSDGINNIYIGGFGLRTINNGGNDQAVGKGNISFILPNGMSVLGQRGRISEPFWGLSGNQTNTWVVILNGYEQKLGL